ncbi:hypothetical protein [Sphingobium mellinum]|uniref:hypothetical protein n=1 Tax=Sphingobium mellinum TaxID=1387166 RepID=UPI0030ED7145
MNIRKVVRPLFMGAILSAATGCASHAIPPVPGFDNLITIPGDVLQVPPAGEANYCFNDASGAAVCEHREPDQAQQPVKPPLPRAVPSKRHARQRG